MFISFARFVYSAITIQVFQEACTENHYKTIKYNLCMHATLHNGCSIWMETLIDIFFFIFSDIIKKSVRMSSTYFVDRLIEKFKRTLHLNTHLIGNYTLVYILNNYIFYILIYHSTCSTITLSVDIHTQNDLLSWWFLNRLVNVSCDKNFSELCKKNSWRCIIISFKAI